jgi:hypothetical protein
MSLKPLAVLPWQDGTSPGSTDGTPDLRRAVNVPCGRGTRSRAEQGIIAAFGGFRGARTFTSTVWWAGRRRGRHADLRMA